MFRGVQPILLLLFLYYTYAVSNYLERIQRLAQLHIPVAASSEQIFAQSLFLPNKKKQKDIMDQRNCVKKCTNDKKIGKNTHTCCRNRDKTEI